MITKFDGHTPGPWTARQGLDDKFVTSKDGKNICVLTSSREEVKANHGVLAASPDLLDRLKAMYGMLKLLEHCDIGRCPVCSFTRKNGHVDNCELKFELILTEQLLGINQTEVKT